MKVCIYADNAATTQLDKAAFEAMVPWLTDEYGNPSQPYSFSRSAKKALADSRETIAACINADPDEIYFTSGGTEGDNWAIKGLAFLNDDRRNVITSAFEHHAILRSCEVIKRIGHPVTYIEPDQNGMIMPNTLESSISAKQPFLVTLMYVNNELGTIQPIQELCEIAHAHNAFFHTDAVQAVGHTEINVKKLGVDLLTASAHKFNGPKGVGFQYVRKGVMLPSYVDGGAQEFGFRAGTENVASIVGMAIALRNNIDQLKANKKKVRFLEQLFFDKINESQIPYIRNGGKQILPGIINLSFYGKDGEAILHRMDLKGISISTGSACDSKNTEISHVLKAIKLDERYARGTIRISLGKNNSSEDIEAIVNALVQIVK